MIMKKLGETSIRNDKKYTIIHIYDTELRGKNGGICGVETSLGNSHWYWADSNAEVNCKLCIDKFEFNNLIKTFKPNQRLNTPQGLGTLYSIDGEIMCVELDSETNVLHEFDMAEIHKIA